SPEITALQDVALTTRWFNDFRFVLRQIGVAPALIHLEPDLWGYAEQMSADATSLAAAVTRGNPTDCAGQPDSRQSHRRRSRPRYRKKGRRLRRCPQSERGSSSGEYRPRGSARSP